MPFGFHGKILHVNLTNRTFEIETPGERFYRTYLGGKGFVAYYLFKGLQYQVTSSARLGSVVKTTEWPRERSAFSNQRSVTSTQCK